MLLQDSLCSQVCLPKTITRRCCHDISCATAEHCSGHGSHCCTCYEVWSWHFHKDLSVIEVIHKGIPFVAGTQTINSMASTLEHQTTLNLLICLLHGKFSSTLHI